MWVLSEGFPGISQAQIPPYKLALISTRRMHHVCSSSEESTATLRVPVST